MSNVLKALWVVLALTAAAEVTAAPTAIAIHGGAGTILKSEMSDEEEAAYRAKLEEALRAGNGVLTDGGSAVDAVQAAINVMEDSPLFNAGKGAVFTAEGANEMDASIMDGASGAAGAVAGVRHPRNPIDLARRVMEASKHVLLTGSGAEEFALEQGVTLMPRSYFHTERRWGQLQDALAKEHESAAMPAAYRMGTVGAVALDAEGHLAAGTSTGGMTAKRYGRVGDSPIIGAGTWADDATCAVSATGHGEYFIRGAIAHDIHANMAYAGRSVGEAARYVIMDKLTESGGTGGVIAMDATGAVSMPFNTEGMYRGVIGTDGSLEIRIYGGEPDAEAFQ